jgi:hypothetical protein
VTAKTRRRRRAPAAALPVPGRGRELSELRRRARRWDHRPARAADKRRAIADARESTR